MGHTALGEEKKEAEEDIEAYRFSVQRQRHD
jgi:hypothetical protein